MAQNANISHKLGFWEKTGFGAGDAACNMLFNPITMFLSFFYTDIFGLTPAMVATMFLVVRFVDAVFDPLYGAFIDKTRSKYGRYRPWRRFHLFCQVCVGLWRCGRFRVLNRRLGVQCRWCFLNLLLYQSL